MPTETWACEYATGSVRTASRARYFRYRITTSIQIHRYPNPETSDPWFLLILPNHEPSIHWNRVGGEKLQISHWLISAIMVAFNHLEGLMTGMGFAMEAEDALTVRRENPRISRNCFSPKADKLLASFPPI
jgi:hypothetical protein